MPPKPEDTSPLAPVLVEVPTAGPTPRQPWSFAQTLFVRILLASALATLVIGITDYRAGISNRWDLVMMPTLGAASLATAWVVARRPAWMPHALTASALSLVVYCEGIFYQAIRTQSSVDVYSMASAAQFIPGVYIALFVILKRHAQWACWLIYLTVAALCAAGLMSATATDTAAAATQGQLYWAILLAHPCCIGVLSFMTHLRQQVDDAQRASIEAKERFLAVVSHEVRSPLQTMVSSLELFESAPPGNIANRAIARMKGAAAALETQVRDLTAFTKLELSPALDIGELCPHDVLDDVHQVYEAQAHRRGLSFKLEGDQQPRLLQADGARLRQVLENLVGNALKYTAKGEVTLGFALTPQGESHFWVSDTGRGIAPQHVQAVFEPFVRLKAKSQERIEGSGLGLAVVRQLVGLMQGRIQVESAEGQGTTVHVHLPLPTAEREATEPWADKAWTVLVVDDDPDILAAVGELLKALAAHFQVLTVASGDEALRMVRAQAMDIALIDLQLPGCSGYDVARAARQTTLNGQAYLIAMSANALDKQAPGACAFNAQLAKPFTQAAFIRAMQQAAARR